MSLGTGWGSARSLATAAEATTLSTVSAPAPDLELDLDLETFSGPFDLLLAIVLREEVSLLDVELGEVVAAYIAHLEQKGELDLESATEFLVLIASLLEIKSRLLLPVEEEDEGAQVTPEEAVEELLARMLEYRRYRDASAEFVERFEANRGYLPRAVPPPPELRSATLDAVTAVYEPDQLAAAIGDLLAPPPEPDVSHIRTTVSLERRMRALRDVLARGGRSQAIDFDQAFGGEDRLTQAVTIFALLELYRRGEVSWEQDRAFGPISIRSAPPPAEADSGAIGALEAGEDR